MACQPHPHKIPECMNEGLWKARTTATSDTFIDYFTINSSLLDVYYYGGRVGTLLAVVVAMKPINSHRPAIARIRWQMTASNYFCCAAYSPFFGVYDSSGRGLSQHSTLLFMCADGSSSYVLCIPHQRAL